EYLAEIRDRRESLESDIDSIEAAIAELSEEHADFLLAAEERPAIDVQRREAHLSFATTKNAFVAEGWVPTERYDDLEDALATAVGNHVAVEELERAAYDGDGRVTDREPTESSGSGGTGGATEAEVAADGGTDTAIGNREPPVVQDNPDAVRPFEVLVRTVSRALHSERDPQTALLLRLRVRS